MRTNTRNRLALLCACMFAMATSSCVLFNGDDDGDDDPVKLVDGGGNCSIYSVATLCQHFHTCLGCMIMLGRYHTVTGSGVFLRLSNAWRG